MHFKSDRSIVVATLVVGGDRSQELGLGRIEVHVLPVGQSGFRFVDDSYVAVIAVLFHLDAAPVTWPGGRCGSIIVRVQHWKPVQIKASSH